jgi:hypothetical protein
LWASTGNGSTNSRRRRISDNSVGEAPALSSRFSSATTSRCVKPPVSKARRTLVNADPGEDVLAAIDVASRHPQDHAAATGAKLGFIHDVSHGNRILPRIVSGPPNVGVRRRIRTKFSIDVAQVPRRPQADHADTPISTMARILRISSSSTSAAPVCQHHCHASSFPMTTQARASDDLLNVWKALQVDITRCHNLHILPNSEYRSICRLSPMTCSKSSPSVSRTGSATGLTCFHT